MLSLYDAEGVSTIDNILFLKTLPHNYLIIAYDT